MRIFLLPISTTRTFIYCQRLNQHALKEQTYIDKLTTRASNLWVKWEKYDKGWQKKVTEYGDKIFQRIPYEEWGLKSIPPLSASREAEKLKATEKTDVTFPPSLIKPQSVGEVLRTLATERQALHTKRMWWSIAFTFLRRVKKSPDERLNLAYRLPNLPFFYLCFRAWSHWRALSGSKHIEFILNNDLMRQSPSSVLDMLYAVAGIDANLDRVRKDLELMNGRRSRDPKQSDIAIDESRERMLLSRKNGKLFAQMLEVPELEPELARAVWQVEKALSAREELQEEKSEIESATKGPVTTSKE